MDFRFQAKKPLEPGGLFMSRASWFGSSGPSQRSYSFRSVNAGTCTTPERSGFRRVGQIVRREVHAERGALRSPEDFQEGCKDWVLCKSIPGYRATGLAHGSARTRWTETAAPQTERWPQ